MDMLKSHYRSFEFPKKFNATYTKLTMNKIKE